MFIDCPYCGFLVSVDDQGRPLPRCPNCAQRLREDAEDAAPAPDDAAPWTAERLQPQAPAAAQSFASPEAARIAAGVAMPGREDVGREPSVQALPEDAADPQAVRNEATDSAQPPAKAEAASAHAEAATGPAYPGTPKDETRPAANATASSVVVPVAETMQPGADAIPGAARASGGAIATAAVVVPPAAPSMPQDPAATAVAATPEPTDPTVDAMPPVVEAEYEAPTASAVADADVIGELVQRETPVEAEIEAPIAAGTPEPGEGGGAVVAQRLVPKSIAQAKPEIVARTPSVPGTGTPARTPGKPRATPSFVRKGQATEPAGRRLLLRCCVVAALSLLLALQLLLSERARLAADAGWRPLLASLCGVLHCSLPAWREPLAFELLERDVRAHPSLPGVLRVSARIRNGARWPQAWPVLQLTFSDVHGRSVATRLFQPREYLGGAPAQSVLGRGQVAGVSMDVIEPGAQAVAFTFDFK